VHFDIENIKTDGWIIGFLPVPFNFIFMMFDIHNGDKPSVPHERSHPGLISHARPQLASDF
jgi:hypothetical protein